MKRSRGQGLRARKRPRKRPPSDLTQIERWTRSRDIRLIAGVDEVGRGSLAGPVVAAAVILPDECSIEGIRDSKELTPRSRERLFEIISRRAPAIAWAAVDAQEIDRTDILRASLKAMRIAVENLWLRPDYLLIDGPFPIEHDIPQRPLIGGDSLSACIAAASIIAKVTRDRMMQDFEAVYPSFRFSVHKGYGTAGHRLEIARCGPSPIHRRSFKGVGDLRP